MSAARPQASRKKNKKHPAPASRMLLQGLLDTTAAPAARCRHPEADLAHVRTHQGAPFFPA